VSAGFALPRANLFFNADITPTCETLWKFIACYNSLNGGAGTPSTLARLFTVIRYALERLDVAPR
jgi:hypothetical protein